MMAWPAFWAKRYPSPVEPVPGYKAVDYWQKQKEPLIGAVDFKPALSAEKLDARFLREIGEQNKQILHQFAFHSFW